MVAARLGGVYLARLQKTMSGGLRTSISETSTTKNAGKIRREKSVTDNAGICANMELPAKHILLCVKRKDTGARFAVYMKMSINCLGGAIYA
jgi:hypothetical protein